jgi:hypothetical protein
MRWRNINCWSLDLFIESNKSKHVDRGPIRSSSYPPSTNSRDQILPGNFEHSMTSVRTTPAARVHQDLGRSRCKVALK